MIRNEQTKLTATYINGVGIAVFAVGGLAPLFSTVYGESVLSWALLATSGVCFVASVVLHLVGRSLLKGLKP